jgi:hypothetical protein
VGHGNYKGLTDAMIMIGRAEEVIVDYDRRYRGKGDEQRCRIG